MNISNTRRLHVGTTAIAPFKRPRGPLPAPEKIKIRTCYLVQTIIFGKPGQGPGPGPKPGPKFWAGQRFEMKNAARGCLRNFISRPMCQNRIFPISAFWGVGLLARPWLAGLPFPRIGLARLACTSQQQPGRFRWPGGAERRCCCCWCRPPRSPTTPQGQPHSRWDVVDQNNSADTTYT